MVPVLEEALAEAVAGMEVLPVTYMIPPPAVDLVMEAEISDRDPLQTDTKTHLMDDSLEVRGRTEVKQPLKDQMAPQVHTIQTVRTIPVQATAVEAETASEVPI